MRLRLFISSPAGQSIVELLFVLAVLMVCAGIGAVALAEGVRTIEARGSAQVWQTAAAWAQVEVLWHGGSSRLTYEAGDLSLTNDRVAGGGRVGHLGPEVSVTTNLDRWRLSEGATVSFGSSGAPDGGGSLYFRAWRTSFRVAVRPESGLTARSLTQP